MEIVLFKFTFHRIFTVIKHGKHRIIYYHMRFRLERGEQRIILVYFG